MLAYVLQETITPVHGLKSSSREGFKHTLGADAHFVLRVVLQETLDTTTRELYKRHGKSVSLKICGCTKKRTRLNGRLQLSHAQIMR